MTRVDLHTFTLSYTIIDKESLASNELSTPVVTFEDLHWKPLKGDSKKTEITMSTVKFAKTQSCPTLVLTNIPTADISTIMLLKYV